MKKVKIEIIGIFSNHPQETNFTLLLGEVDGYRKLPIMIGVVEAQSIALALERSVLERPVVHDLFKEALVKLGYLVEETVITSLKDEVFFAHLLISNGVHQVILEARPSDAIAISLRFEAPLFINEDLLNQTGGTLIPKSEIGNIDLDLAFVNMPFQASQTTISKLKEYSAAELQELLARVVEREDYEQAVLIRDEIKGRNK